MADALGAADVGIESMVQAAEARPTVLILDDVTCLNLNVQLAPLLEHAPTTAVVATSRVHLGMAGEHQWPLGPLTLPQPETPPSDALTTEAVELLVHRVRATRPAFELAPEEISLAAEVTRRLGGLPLAIELAARHWRVRGAAGLLATVRDDPLALHAPGPAGLPHGSLRRAVEATCAPLDAACHKALRCLATLAGGWSLDAAKAALGPEGLIDRLDQLVALGLVEASDAAGEKQFTINPAIHAFAAGDARRADGADDLACAHADFYSRWVTPLGRPSKPRKAPPRRLTNARRLVSPFALATTLPTPAPKTKTQREAPMTVEAEPERAVAGVSITASVEPLPVADPATPSTAASRTWCLLQIRSYTVEITVPSAGIRGWGGNQAERRDSEQITLISGRWPAAMTSRRAGRPAVGRVGDQRPCDAPFTGEAGRAYVFGTVDRTV
jgi:predicted ATPase